MVDRITVVISLPLSPTEPWFYLKGQFPVPEVEWCRMMTILEAMKPALISSSIEGESQEAT